MYSNDYVEEQEEQESGNFITNFYNNNKVLVWVFIGIIVFILLMTLLTKGGSNNKDTGPKDYKVVIIPEDKEIYVSINAATSLKASVEDEPNAKIEWSVDDETIAKVDNNGRVTGVDYGTTTVYATYIDKDDGKHPESRTIIVGDGDKDIKLTDASFADGDLFMSLNSTYQIAVMLTPTRGYIEKKEFRSANTSVVTVDNNGLVTAVGEGDTIITMEINKQFKKDLRVFVDRDYTKTEIIVTPEKISFDGELRKIKVGTVENLSYTVEPKDTDTDKLIWSSSNEEFVTVDEGRIKGIAKGQSTITVEGLNGVKAKIDVEVEEDIVEVSDIYLSTTDYYMNVGDTQVITPVVSPDNASNKALSYASADTSIAFAAGNETGTQATITALRAGTTTIVIRANNNVEKRINVTVASVTPTSSTGGGGNGGNSGSSVGFKISSYDATGEGFINDSYEKTEPAGNGATAPLTVTVQKKSSSVDHLKILVCKYPATSSCGSLGIYTTSGTQTFTLTAAYAYVIRIEEYNSSGTKTRTTDRYAWIKNGSGSITTPRPTGSTGCTSYNTSSRCTVNGCYWYNNSCHATAQAGTTPVPSGSAGCTSYNTSSRCTSNGCYWYNSSCHSLPQTTPRASTTPGVTVRPSSTPSCYNYLTSTTCAGSVSPKCYWYNNSCHPNAQATTSPSGPVISKAYSFNAADGSLHSDSPKAYSHVAWNSLYGYLVGLRIEYDSLKYDVNRVAWAGGNSLSDVNSLKYSDYATSGCHVGRSGGNTPKIEEVGASGGTRCIWKITEVVTKGYNYSFDLDQLDIIATQYKVPKNYYISVRLVDSYNTMSKPVVFKITTDGTKEQANWTVTKVQ